MAGEIFKNRYGKDASSFKSIDEINDFMKEKTGKELPIALRNEQLCINRGVVFEIKNIRIKK